MFEANEEAKARHKLYYDSTHFDVDLVLHHCAAGLDQVAFQMAWHVVTGPYEVVNKKSPVKYEIKDPLDGQIIQASVQQKNQSEATNMMRHYMLREQWKAFEARSIHCVQTAR